MSLSAFRPDNFDLFVLRWYSLHGCSVGIRRISDLAIFELAVLDGVRFLSYTTKTGGTSLLYGIAAILLCRRQHTVLVVDPFGQYLKYYCAIQD